MKNFSCINEYSLKTLIKFLNENFLMYSRKFIEDPDQVYEWKVFDVFAKIDWRIRLIEESDKMYKWKLFERFTKIDWRPWSNFWMKNFGCIHEDLLKIVIKFINENFLMYSWRLIEDTNKVYKWRIFDVFTKIHWRPWSSL